MEVCVLAIAEGRRADQSGRSVTIANAGGSEFFAPKLSCSRRAESARPTRSRATVGIAPATAIRSPTTPARSLIDMEYIQFHPTGMVWPPSVRGMLVTEGVRGEGGILTNKEGERFMFDFIPENYKTQTADNEEEGWRYTQGDKNARRPPELLTRDHVARCIVREIKEGRGTPHGGVFLDISWIKKQLAERGGTHQAQAAEHVSPVQTAGRRRHHEGGDGGRPDHALHHGRSAGRCRYPDVERARAFCRRRMRRRDQRRESARAAIRSPIFWFSGNGRASSRPNSRRSHSLGAIDEATVQNLARGSAPALRTRGGRKSLHRAARVAGHDATQRRHRARRERNAGRARTSAKCSGNARTTWE